MLRPGTARWPVWLCGVLLLPAGPAAGQVPDWSVHEDLRFGVIDPARTAFPDVGVLAEGPDGSLYLGLTHLRLIRVFDSAGEFVREFGGPGIDPGEMGSLSHLGWAGDTLYVADGTFRRFVFFGPDGAPRGAAGGPGGPTPSGLPSPPIPYRLIPEGSALFRVAEREDGPQVTVLLRGERDASRLDTVIVVPSEDDARRVVLKIGDRVAAWENPYVHHPLYAVSPDGRTIVMLQRRLPGSSEHAAYTLTRMTWEGDTVYHRTYDYRPEAVNRELVWRGLAAALAPLLGVDPAGAEIEVRREVDLPDVAPPVTDLRVGTDGAVWVKIWTTPGRPPRWMKKHGDGEPAGRIELPVGAEVLRVEAGAIYVTVAGENGLDLVRYRLRPDAG